MPWISESKEWLNDWIRMPQDLEISILHVSDYDEVFLLLQVDLSEPVAC